MWQPEPGWRQLPGGVGPSTLGVWLALDGDCELVVKRLIAPATDDPGELSDPTHFAFWRRSAEVALDGVVTRTPGLRALSDVTVEEDDDGITLTQPRVPEVVSSGLYVARSLGRFAGAELPGRPWLAQDQLRSRIRRIEQRGGWTTLQRTTVAEVADRLWSHRETLFARCDHLPQVAQHGDPVPANLPGRADDDVIAIDWATLGTGPVGADLGFFALSAKEELTPLLEAYLTGLPTGLATREEAAFGARVTAVYTVFSRAEWALARVDGGAGALAAKYRHPSVAPYLRALQRQLPQIESLLAVTQGLSARARPGG